MLICHCTVGAGLPVADAVNDVLLPASTVVLLGFVVTVGAKSTVNVADVVVALRLALLLKTAWYSSPFSEEVEPLIVNVVVVTPL